MQFECDFRYQKMLRKINWGVNRWSRLHQEQIGCLYIDDFLYQSATGYSMYIYTGRKQDPGIVSY